MAIQGYSPYMNIPNWGNMMLPPSAQFSNNASASVRGINGFTAQAQGYGQFDINPRGIRLSTPFTYGSLFDTPQIQDQSSSVFPGYGGQGAIPLGNGQANGFIGGGQQATGGASDPYSAFMVPSLSPNGGGIPTSMMGLLNGSMGGYPGLNQLGYGDAGQAYAGGMQQGQGGGYPVMQQQGSAGYPQMGGQFGQQAPAGAFAPSYQNSQVQPYEQLPRGIAQQVNHWGYDQYGRVIGNSTKLSSNSTDRMMFQNRVFGPVDPSSLNGSGWVVNPLISGFVSGVGPNSFAEVTVDGAKAYGGGEAYAYSSRSPGGVLLDYAGPRTSFNYNPTINRYQNGY